MARSTEDLMKDLEEELSKLLEEAHDLLPDEPIDDEDKKKLESFDADVVDILDKMNETEEDPEEDIDENEDPVAGKIFMETELNKYGKKERSDVASNISEIEDTTDIESLSSDFSDETSYQEINQSTKALALMFKDFDLSLEMLKNKAKELETRKHQADANATRELYENIKRTQDTFMHAPSGKNFTTFAETCVKLITAAETQLINKHRGSSIFSWVQEKIGADTDTMSKAKGLKEALNKIKLPDELITSDENKNKFKK